MIAQHMDPPEEETGRPFRVSLLSCPTCQNSLIAGEYQEEGSGGPQWDSPVRVWPSPDKLLSWNIPPIVRSSLEEANKCFKARAFSACAVMCGRALEGICRYHKTRAEYLSGGLKELSEQGVIDGRLMKWADALRLSRNAGAHATGRPVLHDEAQDLLLFANAICEYVFVLSAQFDDFMNRQREKTSEP